MRNLKRVLSLSLAFIMLTGLMMVGAGAANYKDESSIKYNEAVDVLSAIGVFSGTDKGEFNPQGDLTRDAAAKIITYMLMGKKAADDLVASSDPYLDVKKDNWAAGSIAYCAQNKIISGDGKGHFFPSNVVTGTQFAKMLLGALGYSSETEGFTGENYELNIAKVVRTAGLTKGLDVSLSATLTREQAAQMALNTLKAYLVEYVGGNKVILPDGTSFISGGTREYVTAVGKDNKEYKVSFREQYFPNLKPGNVSGDEFGRPAHQWKNGVTAIGTYADAYMVQYTASAKESAVKSDLSGYDTASRADAKLYVNGVEIKADTTPTPADKYDMTNAGIAKLTKPGRMVEIYTADEKVTAVVVVDTYLAKINSINTVTGTVSLGRTGAASIDVKKSDNESLYNTLAAMNKGDYVLVNAYEKDSAVYAANMVVPETVTGAFTKVSGGKLTIGGTAYEKSATFSSNPTLGSSYTAYLDVYGNVIGMVAGEEESNSYAYVLSVDRVGSPSQGTTYSAKLLYADGTQEWVEINQITDTNKKVWKASNDGLGLPNDSSSVIAKTNMTFVSYTSNADGVYSLKQVSKSSSVVPAPTTGPIFYDLTNIDIKRNTVKFASETGTTNTLSLNGTNKTIFLVGTNDNTYKVYTGISNVPNYTNVSGKVLVDKGTSSANMVVLAASKATTAATDYVFIVDDAHDSNYDADGNYYTYTSIKPGDVDKAGSLNTVVTSDKDGTKLAQGLYVINQYSGDYANELEKLTTTPPAKDGKVAYAVGTGATVTGGTITITDGDGYVMASKCNAWAVKADGSNASYVDASDIEFYKGVTNVYLIMDNDGFVTTMVFTYTG